MDNVHKHICTNVPSSQTVRPHSKEELDSMNLDGVIVIIVIIYVIIVIIVCAGSLSLCGLHLTDCFVFYLSEFCIYCDM
jgi:hypothetical protein